MLSNTLRRWSVSFLAVLFTAFFVGLAVHTVWTDLGAPRWGADDAQIFFVYARNMVAGHGIVYSVGGPHVEGASSFLSSFPKVADFYRRLYGYICIDEAQDLNEAQYAVIKALCGPEFRNLLMVGDPNQSIYGFNTSSPDYMFAFERDFGAKRVELTENFRSSEAVVRLARSLEPRYLVAAQLPIKGQSWLLVGENEEHEAVMIADDLQRLLKQGHPDVEGDLVPSRCAILGRTRYALLLIEEELKTREIPFYKRFSATHENESAAIEEYQLALRVLANPRDHLHLKALADCWKCVTPEEIPCKAPGVIQMFERLAVDSGEVRAKAIVNAVGVMAREGARLDLMQSTKLLREHADCCADQDRLAIYEDLAVLEREWDQYLRTEATHTISGFMSSRALGTTQQSQQAGVGLLTVHSAKGLEFDLVFVAGMAQGVFPDYRSIGRPKEMAEEVRNAFVAVTRSKRLLALTYPKMRVMPWGDEKAQEPSMFIKQVGLA